MPSKSEFAEMFRMNHDGVGFVTPTKVYHTMDFEDFYEKVKEVPKGEPCIIHFRWATHGSVKLKNTHPFYDKETDVYFAHNGILNIKPKGDMTDSETAFRKYLVPAIKEGGFNGIELKCAVHLILGSSKFAFMHGGDIKMFGHFFEYNGCYYSNLRHLNTPYYWRSA